MNWQMFKALTWKEWRETRWKWLMYFLAFNAWSVFLVTLTVLNEIFPSLLGSDDTNEVTGFIEAALLILSVQAVFLLTIGQLLIAFLAAGSIRSEIGNRNIFFVLERPIKRQFVLLHKFTAGAIKTIVCVGLSPLVCAATFYALLLLSPDNDVTSPTTSDLISVAAISLRLGVWISAICLIVYAMSFLLSIWLEKQWLSAILSAAVLMFLEVITFSRFHRSVEVTLSQRGLEMVEDNIKTQPELFTHLDPVLIGAMLSVAVALYLIAQLTFSHKELK